MARCPLCSERSAKRFCPAKQTTICAVCCGTKREVEIDCPSSCVHLKAGRSYESERKGHSILSWWLGQDPSEQEFLDGIWSDSQRAWDELLPRNALCRPGSWTVDVEEVYRALTATMKTLSSGIYYESLPEGAVRISLFRRLKAILDALMTPSDAQRSARCVFLMSCSFSTFSFWLLVRIPADVPEAVSTWTG